MTAKAQLLFVTSSHNLQIGAERVALGLPLWESFNLLPSTQSTAFSTALLPSRYCLSIGADSTRWHGRQAASLDKQSLTFSPLFSLTRNCSNGCAQHPAARSSLPHHSQQHPHSPTPKAAASYASLADTAAAAAAAATPDSAAARQQLEQQFTLQLPWLGADLDVGGFTKKGFMRGGGKEQNQDRGLIMETFRSPGELLLGVMDGHGTFGHLVSNYLLQHLPAVLMHKLVAAAAAAAQAPSSSSSDDCDLQHRSKQHKHGKQQKQQHQGVPQALPEFFNTQVPFVVVPDHHHHNAGAGSSTSSHNSSSSAVADAAHKGAAAASRQGRAVTKHQVVPQPEHALYSSNSSSSSSEAPSFTAVPSSSVTQVPLTPSLMTSVFAETEQMLGASGINVLDSGSTALLCHIGHDRITTAWVGDSRAVLGRRQEVSELNPRFKQQGAGTSSSGTSSSSSSSSSDNNWQVIQLSDDHKPERADEQLRIILNNGRVQQIRNPATGQGVGPFRVWFKQIDYPGLAMSRAFGDTPCRRIGVTVEPELYVHRLSEADQLLVAATDGVWEYMSNQEVVELAASCSSAEHAARRLVEAAEQRWQARERGNYVDDITAVVVRATPRRKPGSKL